MLCSCWCQVERLWVDRKNNEYSYLNVRGKGNSVGYWLWLTDWSIRIRCFFVCVQYKKDGSADVCASHWTSSTCQLSTNLVIVATWNLIDIISYIYCIYIVVMWVERQSCYLGLDEWKSSVAHVSHVYIWVVSFQLNEMKWNGTRSHSCTEPPLVKSWFSRHDIIWQSHQAHTLKTKTVEISSLTLAILVITLWQASYNR